MWGSPTRHAPVSSPAPALAVFWDAVRRTRGAGGSVHASLAFMMMCRICSPRAEHYVAALAGGLRPQ